MKIAYIMMQFPTPSETFASNDIKVLKELGIDISTYSLKSKDKHYNELIRNRTLENIIGINGGIKENLIGILYLLKNSLLFLTLLTWIIKNEFNKPKHLIKILALVPMSFYIFEKLKEEPPDIVHLFWGHYPSIVGYLVKEELKNTNLSIFLGAYDLEYGLGISSSIAQNANYVFTHARANLKQLSKLGINENRINIIHRGTISKKILNILNNIEKDANLWLTVGRLLPSKGFDKVINVFKEYQNINKNAKLLILGDGPNKETLIYQVKQLNLDYSIEFGGHVNHETVLTYMGKANVFLLLSSKVGERLPNVIKEAMLAKCICISSNTPGINELIDDDINGFIVEENNYNKIIEKLNNLTKSKKNNIVDAAKQKIIEDFDVEVSMKKYLKVWKG